MATQKQVETIRIGAFYFNGAYRAFHTETNSVNTYPISLPVWEAQFTESLEFVSGSVTQALTGNERGNISGYRANVDIFLDNSYPAESTKIRTLLEKFANQYDRTVLQTSKGTVTNTTVVLVNGVGAGNDNYYKNLTLINASNTSDQAIVTAYNSTTKVATVATVQDFATWGDILVVAKANIPTVLGVSTDNTDGNIIYCNLTDGSFGFRREQTVNMQSIRISAREVQRTPLISDKYRVG
jgi:hypothetical protein